jgi:hypothetical protein
MPSNNKQGYLCRQRTKTDPIDLLYGFVLHRRQMVSLDASKITVTTELKKIAIFCDWGHKNSSFEVNTDPHPSRQVRQCDC